jgi:hypothetical protein
MRLAVAALRHALVRLVGHDLHLVLHSSSECNKSDKSFPSNFNVEETGGGHLAVPDPSTVRGSAGQRG